jgi:tetratricopeptide (TPR) repeat protein
MRSAALRAASGVNRSAGRPAARMAAFRRSLMHEVLNRSQRSENDTGGHPLQRSSAATKHAARNSTRPAARAWFPPPRLHSPNNRAIRCLVKAFMAGLQEQYDDAMFAFSTGEYDAAITRLRDVLARDPDHFDAQLALGMAHYRKGDYPAAIAEGHKAEKLRPQEQLVHTNLSLFYMKAGDKQTAEHHGLQARIASWRGNMTAPADKPAGDPELELARPAPPPVRFPAMPWKNSPKAGGGPPLPAATPAPTGGKPDPNHG